MADAADPSLPALRALSERCLVADQRWASPRLEQAAARLARGQQADRLLGEIVRRLTASAAEVERRGALPVTIAYPDQLPVAARRDEVLARLARDRLLVLTGETGSGKTTQLPKMLYEAGCGRRGMIALTQPRRVAAVAMAARLREECRAGEQVIAHSVRFDDRAGPDTVVRVMTDGLLLAEAANDRDLSRYDALIIDEAHERSLNIDLLIGLVRLLRARRPELVVVISSASIEAERFAGFFAPAGAAPADSILRVSGRTFPVEIRYAPPGDDDIGYLAAALAAIRGIHGDAAGDVLVFLPTERDIIEARRRLDDLPGATVLPLFGRLTPREQQRVFAPARGRKIVLATNLAETSLTIPGIRYVVDTGLARLKRYQASSRTERLPVEAVAQASCTQRAGRAGRVEAGVCIRLFGEEDFTARPPYTTPEILRSNLAGVLLQCLGMGVGDPERFPWLDAPSSHAWQQARLLLDELGAFEADRPSTGARGQAPPTAQAAPSGVEPADHRPGGEGPRSQDAGSRRLSALGRRMAAIPADPQVARILLAGIDEGVAHEACTLAAFLSVQDPRVRPLGQEAKADAAHRAMAHEAGDLATVLRLWERYQAAGSNAQRNRLCESAFLGFRRMREWADVRHQLWQSLREGRGAARQLPAAGHQAETWPLDRVHRAVLAGMLGNVLMWDKTERVYRGAGDRRLHVHPGSALRSGKSDDGKRAPPPQPWLVACEVVETSRLFARLCAPIDPGWVVDLAGDRVKRRHRDPHYHVGRRQVVCVETVTWKGLPVREGRLVPYERVDPRDATAVFVREALGGEELEAGFPFVARNRDMLASLRRLRARLRDPSLHVDELALERFYRERLGLEDGSAPCIASTDALRRWLATNGEARLLATPADLLGPEAAAAVERAARDFPEEALMGGRRFALTYRFAPGDDDDGTTIELAEEHLAQLDIGRLEWLVPGRLTETVAALLEQLPKDQRRLLIPLADTAREIAAQLIPRAGCAPLAALVVEAARARGALRCPQPDPGALPAHLRLRFRISGPGGVVVYAGRDPQFLAAQAAAAGDRLRAVRSEWETAPGGAWPGDCPLAVELHGVRAATALVRARDEHGSVAARRAVFATAEAATAWHGDGVDALLEAQLAEQLERLALAAAAPALAARCERAFAMRIGALRRQLALAAVAGVERGAVRVGAEFDALRERSAHALAAAGPGLDGLIDQVADRLERLRARLRQGAKSLAAATVTRLASQHLDLLLAPGWSARLPWSAAQRLPAYLDGVARFLDAAATRPQEAQRAAQRCAALIELWEETVSGTDARLPAALGLMRTVGELAWVLEECLLAASDARGGGAGYAEGRLRAGLAEFAKQAGAAQRTQGEFRQRLLDLRPVVARLPPGPGRDRLVPECERLLAAAADLGLGCDLWAQRSQVAAFAERVAVFAARS